MAIGSAGNVARLYSRQLYSERITIGSNDDEKAVTYEIMARGYEDRIKDPLYRRVLSMHGSNADEFINNASSTCEKAGDCLTDSAKKILYYKKALRFAKRLPGEDREAKELRISLKIRKSVVAAPRMERSDIVTDINAFREKKLERSQQLKQPHRS